ncbi:hypothetical protein D3C73_21550 [compost metagenome]
MSKKAGRSSKKTRLIVITALILVAAAGSAAAYYGYSNWRDNEEAAKSARNESVRQAIAKLPRKGDSDLTIAYTEAIIDGDKQKARHVYIDRVSGETDMAKKMGILSQYRLIANENKLHDQELEAALELDKLQSTHFTLVAVARAYEYLNEEAKRVEYLNKAIAALDSMPQDENTKNFKDLYVSQRDQSGVTQ